MSGDAANPWDEIRPAGVVTSGRAATWLSAEAWLDSIKARPHLSSSARLAQVLANLGGHGEPFEASLAALDAAAGAKSGTARRGIQDLAAAGLIEIMRHGRGGRGRGAHLGRYRLLLAGSQATVPAPRQAEPARATAPPRPITPAARRLINDRLETVYDDERGYVDAWTDKRLAEEIGCPLKWVAEVRELMFGPLKVNPALAAEAAAAIEVVNRAAAQLADMKSERAALAGLLAEMDQKCARIEGDLGAAMAAVRRIEEAVRP